MGVDESLPDAKQINLFKFIHVTEGIAKMEKGAQTGFL